MTPEQQTPASVDLMIVRRLAEGLRRKAVEYRKGDKPQRAEGCDEDADALERVALHVERLSAEREVLREAADWIAETPCRAGCSSWRGAETRNRCDCGRDQAIAALTQGESRQTLPAAPTPADGGGE